MDVELSGYRCDDAPLPFDDEADDDNLPMEVGEEDGNNRSENCVRAEGEQGTNSNTSQEQEHQIQVKLDALYLLKVYMFNFEKSL